MRILVIDGQGGGIGRSLIAGVEEKKIADYLQDAVDIIRKIAE